MHLNLTNWTVSIFLLMVWTVATFIVRLKKPLESNWPLIFWVVMTAASVRWSDELWDYRFLLGGLMVALVLRFEFLNETFINIFRVMEGLAYGWVLVDGFRLLTR